MVRLLPLVLLLVTFGRAAESSALPIVPSGFTAQLYAREPLIRNPCAMAFDGRGRLFVGQGPQYRNPKPDTPGDTIEMLIDSDGDGVADQAKTFARGLNCVQGLAWRGRDLWVANAPDLTIVRDLNGDDEADEYVLVYTDLGNIEHGLHGLNWGPDGKLYMSKGNSKGLNQPGRVAPKPFRELFDLPTPPGAPDLPPPRTFTPQTYRSMYHDPQDDWGRMGGILRCDDGGGNLEIVSRGFRNPWDIAFDSGFNWLGTDNDQSEGDRVFMPFFGAHFGWAHTWSPNWTGEGHGPTVPVSAPVFTGSGTGITFADTPGWPVAFRGVWFINDFLHRTTYVYRPTWDGALLKPQGGRWEPFVRGGNALFSPIDIEPGPDGALYITGWGASLAAVFRDGKQVNEGRVFRIAPTDLPNNNWNPPKRAKPIAQWNFDELFDELATEIGAWRINAADELVRRGKAVQADLRGRLQRGGLAAGQETWALWTLGRIEPRNREVDAWFAATGRTLSPNARLQSLRIVGHRVREWQRNATLPAFVAEALRDSEPRVRFAAVQSITLARQKPLSGALWDLAAHEQDRLTFYTAWHGLLELEPVTQLKAKLQDQRGGVRRAALLALLEQGALGEAGVQPLVKDSDQVTAGLAALWLAKRSGNALLVVEPPAGEFTGELRVAITPGIKPSAVSYSTDGSEPDPAKRRGTAKFTIVETTTVKAALFVDGKKVGNTAEVVYRKRAPLPAETVALTPPTEPTTTAAVLPLLPRANPVRGKALFTAAGCNVCHRVDEIGGAFGPDLSGMAARGNPQHIIQSILEPNAAITEGFALLNVKLRDGNSSGGRLQEESAEVLTLMLPDGSSSRIKKTDIMGRESTHVSPMPAFDRVLSPQDAADVTAWLNSDNTANPSAPSPPLTTNAISTPRPAADFSAQLADDRVTITEGGAPVATYVFKDSEILRPGLQNVHAPGGARITRAHPPAPPEASDHATMHPGVWLAFGDINGVDFWRNKGRIEHERFIVPPAVVNDALQFRTASRLLAPSGELVARLELAHRFVRASSDAYLITIEAKLSSDERDLVFGDQEEMGLGVRLTAPLIEKNGGRVANSDGIVGAKPAWGRVAEWCSYAKVIDGRLQGAALFTSPANPQRSWWHTRDYGLMVANGFGAKSLPTLPAGKLTVPRGMSLVLRYGVLVFNTPEAAPPDFAASYRAFAADRMLAP